MALGPVDVVVVAALLEDGVAQRGQARSPHQRLGPRAPHPRRRLPGLVEGGLVEAPAHSPPAQPPQLPRRCRAGSGDVGGSFPGSGPAHPLRRSPPAEEGEELLAELVGLGLGRQDVAPAHRKGGESEVLPHLGPGRLQCHPQRAGGAVRGQQHGHVVVAAVELGIGQAVEGDGCDLGPLAVAVEVDAVDHGLHHRRRVDPLADRQQHALGAEAHDRPPGAGVEVELVPHAQVRVGAGRHPPHGPGGPGVGPDQLSGDEAGGEAHLRLFPGPPAAPVTGGGPKALGPDEDPGLEALGLGVAVGAAPVTALSGPAHVAQGPHGHAHR